MSLTAIGLLIISACMHASWNFISKRQQPSLAFFCITTLAAAIFICPYLMWQRDLVKQIPLTFWQLVFATGIAQLIYFGGLAGAYRRGDMSLAYPLARAMPVLLIAGISIFLGNGADIGRIGLIGMGLITLGCILLPLRRWRDIRLGGYFDGVYLMAFMAALGTTGYTLIDDIALKQLHALFASGLSNGTLTLLFVGLEASVTALLLTMGTLLIPPERRNLQVIIKNRSLLLSGALTGIMILATYGLVLAAMAHVDNVSYVAAFRQLSIPIGAMLGLTIQKEPRYLPKLIGIVVVSAGLLMVGIG